MLVVFVLVALYTCYLLINYVYEINALTLC